jgi:hypothetical protein
VIIDSSSSAEPSTIRPSAGTRAPDRTSTTSPTRSCATGTVSTPSSVTRSASSGSRAASAAKAPWACPIAFISCQCPSNMMVTSAASSHQKSRSNRPAAVASDAAYATVMAIEISNIMPGARSRTSRTPPTRNGQPP